MGGKSETELLKDIGEYRYGFSDPETYVLQIAKGIDREKSSRIFRR